MIDRPLETFSVAFKERAFSELEYARQVATRDRRRRARDRHRRARLLRRAAAAGLARGRADRASVERAAVLRLEARARARQGRADGRRQRRAARRLRQVSARAGNWRAGRVYEQPGAASRSRRLRRRHVVPRLPGRARALRQAIVPGDAAHARSDVLRQLRGDRPRDQQAAARRRLRAGAPTRRRLRRLAGATSIVRTAGARCSIGCSTPT